METRTEIVPVELDDGKVMHVEAVVLGEEDVAFGKMSLDDLGNAIEHLTTIVTRAIEKARPSKAGVEFGVDCAVEAGQLTALFAKGSATASLKVTLEWGSS